ncbi:hypothetical protein [Mycobacterium sp. 1465703.0]|uniref:hypothetical protein n=1 Tax=Mycobacterium sp. 1465703.0 TaxID=1834078 RepID=UPI0007FC1D18|nr:hypothetical protein [Mycobacterium sp. 1465703.0]OBI98077.1 hypothetical protein A5625_05170 [Mycobacterium sp. 1465703.0]
MTTWELTPNDPNPLTGFANPVIGWHVTLATALDVLEGCNTIFAAGWASQLGPLATSDPATPIWELVVNKGKVQVVVKDTDWFVFDGQNVWAIAESDVTAGYTVTEHVHTTGG